MLQRNQILKVTLLSEQFSPQVFSHRRLYICIGTGKMSSFIYIDMKPKSWRFEMAFNIGNATGTQNSHPAEINRWEKAIWPYLLTKNILENCLYFSQKIKGQAKLHLGSTPEKEHVLLKENLHPTSKEITEAGLLQFWHIRGVTSFSQNLNSTALLEAVV